LRLNVAANHKSRNLATHLINKYITCYVLGVLFLCLKVLLLYIRLTYSLKQTKSFHGQLIINKSLSVKMNKKSLAGGIYF